MFVDPTRPGIQDAELRLDYLDPITLTRGCAVIDSLAHPSYAGVRVCPQLIPEQLMMQARQRSLRYRLANVPLVGAQLGLQYNPDAPDFRDVLGRFLAALRPFLESTMSLGPDLNVSTHVLEDVLHRFNLPPRIHVMQQRQGWDAARWHHYEQLVAMPVTPHETVADTQTPYSVACATLTAMRELSLRELSVAVLGHGPFGARTARYLHQMGAKVVALGDTTAAVHNAHGLRPEVLDAESLVEVDVTSAMYITGDEFLSLPVDAIVAASHEDLITIDNVGHLRAGLVVVAATHAVTADAEKVLTARGIPVFPSFAATVGPVFLTDGVLRQHLETPQAALDFLARSVQRTTSEIMRLSSSLRISLREAGLRLAFHQQFEKQHPLRRVTGRIPIPTPRSRE